MSAESILYFRSSKREISDPHGRITGADELMMRNTRYSSYSSLFRPHCFHHGSGGICSMPLALFSKPQCFHEFSSLFFQALSTLEIDRVIFRAYVSLAVIDSALLDLVLVLIMEIFPFSELLQGFSYRSPANCFRHPFRRRCYLCLA